MKYFCAKGIFIINISWKGKIYDTQAITTIHTQNSLGYSIFALWQIIQRKLNNKQLHNRSSAASQKEISHAATHVYVVYPISPIMSIPSRQGNARTVTINRRDSTHFVDNKNRIAFLSWGIPRNEQAFVPFTRRVFWEPVFLRWREKKWWRCTKIIHQWHLNPYIIMCDALHLMSTSGI